MILYPNPYPGFGKYLEARSVPTIDTTRSQALALGRAETSLCHLCRWPRCSGGVSFAQAEKSTATMPLMCGDMAGGPNWPGVCIRSLSRIRALAPLEGALRRLRIVGGVGIVFGYSRDEPASGKRLQVRL